MENKSREEKSDKKSIKDKIKSIGSPLTKTKNKVKEEGKEQALPIMNDSVDKIQKTAEINPKEFWENLIPLIASLAPSIIEYQKIQAPLIKRSQYLNFFIMLIVLIIIFLLAFFQKIDGSATTGLIGAIIGYVFGTLYSRDNRK